MCFFNTGLKLAISCGVWGVFYLIALHLTVLSNNGFRCVFLKTVVTDDLFFILEALLTQYMH